MFTGPTSVLSMLASCRPCAVLQTAVISLLRPLQMLPQKQRVAQGCPAGPFPRSLHVPTHSREPIGPLSPLPPCRRLQFCPGLHLQGRSPSDPACLCSPQETTWIFS